MNYCGTCQPPLDAHRKHTGLRRPEAAEGPEVSGRKPPAQAPQLGKGWRVKSHTPRLGQVAHCPPGFHLQEISRLLKFTFRIK